MDTYAQPLVTEGIRFRAGLRFGRTLSRCSLNTDDLPSICPRRRSRDRVYVIQAVASLQEGPREGETWSPAFLPSARLCLRKWRWSSALAEFSVWPRWRVEHPGVQQTRERRRGVAAVKTWPAAMRQVALSVDRGIQTRKVEVEVGGGVQAEETPQRVKSRAH